MATRCRFRGRRSILWDVLKIDGSLARNIDFEVANLKVPKKTRRKTSILRPRSVKLFWCPHVSRREALGFLWPRCVFGGICKRYPFRMFSLVKIGGNLARNPRFSAPTCLLWSLWFSCGLAVSMGEAAKPLLFGGFQAGCSVVLRGRGGTLWHYDNVWKVVFCGFSQDELQFSWQAQHFGDLCHHFAWPAKHFRRVALPALHSTLYTPHSTLCTSHSNALHSTLYTPHSTLSTLQSTLYTPHSTLHTPHSTHYLLHSTLNTLHFTLHTSHSPLYTPHSTLHTLHFTLHTQHYTLYTSHSTLYTPQSTLYTPHVALHTVHSTLYTSHSTLYSPHFTRNTPHFALHTPHSTLHTLHSTLYISHSTLNTL